MRVLKSAACPVERFPERANNPARLREHFMYLHWKYKMDILQEGQDPLPRRDHCGIHIRVARTIKHSLTEI